MIDLSGHQDDLSKFVEEIWQWQVASSESGELVSSEEIFAKHPDIVEHPDYMLDVILNEFAIRTGDPEDRPDVTEFIKRFPDLKDSLKVQLRLFSVLDSADQNQTATDAAQKAANYSVAADRFQQLEPIGEGATSTVYRAWDSQLQLWVAIKKPHHHLDSSNRARARLIREAQTASRLHHPHIVPFREIVVQDGELLLVSKWIDGDSLQKYITREPTSPNQCAIWTRQIAEALDYAHANGILHRDVKPSNILIDRDGCAMLTDFGLAGLHDAQIAITQTGDLIGTPAFMSPEQASGNLDRMDRRTDVYSLGATLYFLLTNQLPFSGSFSAVVHQVVNVSPTPVRSVNEQVSGDLAIITQKCLNKLPEDRYQTARELSDDLSRFLSGDVISARPAGIVERSFKFARRRPVWVAISTSMLLLVAFAAGSLWQLSNVTQQRNRARSAEQANSHLLAQASIDAGELAMQKGRMSSAVKHFDNALQRKCDDPIQIQLKLIECFLASGEVDNAAEYLTRAKKSNVSGKLEPQIAYWQQELSALGLKEWNNSPKLTETQAASLSPARRLFLQGLSAEDSETALQLFRKTIETNPNHHSARKMSLIMALSLARFDDVLRDASVARQMYPDDVDFRLMTAMALAMTGRKTEAFKFVDEATLPPNDTTRWHEFCEFLFSATQLELKTTISQKHLMQVAELTREYLENYHPLLVQRRWQFPPAIGATFTQLTRRSLDLEQVDAWQLVTRELANMHPEATILVIAAESELASSHTNQQLEASRDLFRQALEYPSFVSPSHDCAWIGVYATAMKLAVIQQHDVESNTELYRQAAEHIPAEWVDTVPKLRAFAITLMRAQAWDTALPFVERWFDIAPDKASQLEALWHLAVLRRNQEEWVLVIKLCDRAAEEYFSEDNLTSNWKSVRDHAVEQLQNVIERKPEQHDSKDE